MFSGVGCFPLLIQMPFFSAIYFAAQYTDGVSSSTFLGINLGSPSIILVAFAGILYYLQSLLSLHGSRRRDAKRSTQENDLHEPTHDCRLLLFAPASGHFTGLSVVS